MIPKPDRYHYNIVNTRPIALLDVFRKLATKIMGSRLSALFSQHQVLRGHNYCGLKGDSTENPIHLVNNIIEDARQNKRELWVLTQDMAKAYDSVCLESLRLSLQRIDLPPKFVTWICSIFESRQMKIITAFGLSPHFTGADILTKGIRYLQYCGAFTTIPC